MKDQNHALLILCPDKLPLFSIETIKWMLKKGQGLDLHVVIVISMAKITFNLRIF